MNRIMEKKKKVKVKSIVITQKIWTIIIIKIHHRNIDKVNRIMEKERR